MPDLKIDIEWMDPEGVRGEELRATWASVSISVGDDVITRVLDRRVQTVRSGVIIPLYPLAEWVATRWWFLRFEAENPEKNDSPDFRARHCLAEGREGYAMPQLHITPMGPFTRLSWSRETLPFHGIEFLQSGLEHTRTESFLHTLADFVHAVIGRLDALGIQGTLLQEEWQAVQATDAEELDFCAASAALGIDPYCVTPGEAESIEALAEQMSDTLFEEFLWISDPAHALQHATEVTSAITRARSQRVALEQLRELRAEGMVYPNPDQPPWIQGFGLARTVREHLGLNGKPLPTHEELADGFHIDEESLRSTIETAKLPTYLLDGVVAENREGSPSLVLRPRSAEASRFHLCRGVAEYLTGAPGNAAILTRAGSERQARNRAFAAEFLAPSTGLRQVITKARLGADELEEIAEVFGVSSAVIYHQVQNHEIAHVVPGGP